MTDRGRGGALAVHAMRRHEAERSHLARELHESAAQTIAGLGYQLSAAAREAAARADEPLAVQLRTLHALADAALEQVRTLAHAIHPRVLDDLGLEAALGWLARRTRQATGLHVLVERAAAPLPISREAAATLFHVAREALQNVEVHAGAATAWISLDVESGVVRLAVRDDGRGFDLVEAEARQHGVGLLALRERVAATGGALLVDTAPGRGTCIQARVPVAA